MAESGGTAEGGDSSIANRLRGESWPVISARSEPSSCSASSSGVPLSCAAMTGLTHRTASQTRSPASSPVGKWKCRVSVIAAVSPNGSDELLALVRAEANSDRSQGKSILPLSEVPAIENSQGPRSRMGCINRQQGGGPGAACVQHDHDLSVEGPSRRTGRGNQRKHGKPAFSVLTQRRKVRQGAKKAEEILVPLADLRLCDPCVFALKEQTSPLLLLGPDGALWHGRFPWGAAPALCFPLPRLGLTARDDFCMFVHM